MLKSKNTSRNIPKFGGSGRNTMRTLFPEDQAKLKTLFLSKRSETFFFFNDTATTEIYTLSLHDGSSDLTSGASKTTRELERVRSTIMRATSTIFRTRSEEHTSELQSLTNLVCRLLLEKKKKKYHQMRTEKMAMHNDRTAE